jgi:hypothetical protein
MTFLSSRLFEAMTSLGRLNLFPPAGPPELSCGFKGDWRSNWLDHRADQLVGIQEGDDL